MNQKPLSPFLRHRVKTWHPRHRRYRSLKKDQTATSVPKSGSVLGYSPALWHLLVQGHPVACFCPLDQGLRHLDYDPCWILSHITRPGLKLCQGPF